MCSQTVMNTTRTAFGKHIQGYIFPLLLNVKAMESSFAGIIQELKTSDNFILFTSKSLRITEATQESMKLLGVSDALDCSKAIAGYRTRRSTIGVFRKRFRVSVDKLLCCRFLLVYWLKETCSCRSTFLKKRWKACSPQLG
jgi:hypothetical protein